MRPKLLLVMKLAFVLLITAFLQLSYAGHAQKITLFLEDASLEQVFRQLRQQSGCHFLYDAGMLEEAGRVDIKLENASLEEALRQCFTGQPLTYILKKNTVVVKRKSRALTRLARETAPLQDDTVRGTVTDTTGAPLPGVSVLVKGKPGRGTSTGTGGAYALPVPPDAVLVFSYLGFATQEIPVNGRRAINAVLREEGTLLDELVVVGYGTQKRSDLTGAITSVRAEELTAYPASGALQALQGRAAGVTIQSTNSEPGGSFKIRVRGGSSINASSDPLYVVDGIVGGLLPAPEDIASLEVLKDASATAIYGSRAANGVVMITTKSGNPGPATVSLNSSYSSQREIGRLELLNAREFAEYINEARGADFYDLNALETNTDWQDLIFRRGHIQNHQLSVSGGSDRIQYYVSGVYYDQMGVIKSSEFNRLSLTSNLRFDLSDKIRIHLNSILRSSKQDGVRTQGNAGNSAGVITAAQTFEPTVGILDADGNYTQSKVGIAPFPNPFGVIDGISSENKQEDLQSNVKAEFDLAEGLVFNSTFGVSFRNQRNGVYYKRISNIGEATNGSGTLTNIRNSNFLTEQYLNYDADLGERSRFALTAGYSYQHFTNESFSASNSGFISDVLGFWNLGAGTNFELPESEITESEITSFYGRINYNFDDRYLLTFTGRYDGASQFSKGNKWSFFPSGALSWNISNEHFYPENNTVPTLRLRASYGLTGNQAIIPYQSLARISPTLFVRNDAIVSSVRPTAIANEGLTWETTAQFDIGLDAEFFGGRISLSGDYYNKRTRDLLFSVPLPAFSGYQSRLENLGKIENKGVELEIESANLTNVLKWSTSLNVTWNKNKVLALPGGVDILYSGSPTFVGNGSHAILREGEPIGSFYGFDYQGVYQEGDEFIPGGSFETEPGGEKFADLNRDGVLNNDDRKILGDPNPDVVWGLSNDFSFKGFNLNVFVQAYTGGDILNLTKMELDRLSGNSNATTDALNRWTPENTDTDVPKAKGGRVGWISSRFLEDGSYIRVKNISIGYDLPADFLSKLKIRTARIYLSGQNLFTITNYSGVDPEVAYNSSGATDSNINLGLDYDSYPNTTSYTLGINLGF